MLTLNLGFTHMDFKFQILILKLKVNKPYLNLAEMLHFNKLCISATLTCNKVIPVQNLCFLQNTKYELRQVFLSTHFWCMSAPSTVKRSLTNGEIS